MNNADTMSNIAASATDTMNSAVDGLARGAEVQKNAGADALAGIARSVRGSADSLEAQSPQVARAVRMSADTVERFSRDVKDKSVNELLDATTTFARQRPYMFLSLGVLAGVVLARAFENSR